MLVFKIIIQLHLISENFATSYVSLYILTNKFSTSYVSLVRNVANIVWLFGNLVGKGTCMRINRSKRCRIMAMGLDWTGRSSINGKDSTSLGSGDNSLRSIKLQIGPCFVEKS